MHACLYLTYTKRKKEFRRMKDDERIGEVIAKHNTEKEGELKFYFLPAKGLSLSYYTKVPPLLFLYTLLSCFMMFLRLFFSFPWCSPSYVAVLVVAGVL